MDKSFALAFIFVIISILCIGLIFKKAEKMNHDFDERQYQIRNEAFKHGFFAMLLYSSLYLFIIIILEKSLMEDGVSTLFAASIGITVSAVECIWNDAFFTAKNKPIPYLILSAANTILNGSRTLDIIKEGTLVQNGLLTDRSIHPMLSALFFIIFVTIVVKLICNRNQEE